MSFSLDNARYLPCYITEAGVQTLSSGQNTIAEIRDREMKGKMLRVQEVSVDANADILVRLRENNRSIEESNALNLCHTAKFDLHARTLFYMSLYNNLAVSVENFAYRFGYWLKRMDCADKYFYGIRLNDEEEGIADEFDVKRLVDEGSLPLPMDVLQKRIFKKSTTRTVSWHGDLPVAGADVGSEVSSVGKMLIIEGISMEKTPLGTYTSALNITVDERDFHSMRAWAASGSLSDIPLWIPAKDSFSLSLTTNLAIAGFDMRYTYSEFKITPYIETLFNLRLRDEDENMWRRVQSGCGPE